MHVNNRKLSEGFYRALGIEDVEETLRRIDKLEKLGPEKTREILEEVAEASAEEIGVKAIDDYTLEYTLTKSCPYFVSMVSTGANRSL